MREINSQLVANVSRHLNEERVTKTISHSGSGQPQREPVIAASMKSMGDNHPLVRRHSFDDNGGGYEGL